MSDRGGSSINYPVVWKQRNIQESRYTKFLGGGGGGRGWQRTGSPPEMNPAVFCIHIQ